MLYDWPEFDLRLKHQQMRRDLFMFFRGTFYRWAQLWPQDLPRAEPRSEGLSHVAIFTLTASAPGVTRKAVLRGGVDDFDDSYPLPYTNDLVRLAASVKIVKDLGHLTIGLKDSCDVVLQGYRAALRSGGHPLVLAEHEETRKGWVLTRSRRRNISGPS